MTNAEYLSILDEIEKCPEDKGLEQSPQRLPSWFKVERTGKSSYLETMRKISHLDTVCQEARCPNIGECFGHKTAAFLILGDICTRACAFCHISKGIPKEVDSKEPERIAKAAVSLGMKYVVITAVNRDDLLDGGARQFAKVAHAVKREDASIQIEVLTGDFQGDLDSLLLVLDSPIHVFNHNLETVPSLYRSVRPQSSYARSLDLIAQAKRMREGILTKSGLILGLGETYQELLEVMDDLRSVQCDRLTLGQYSRPSMRQMPVHRYIHPEEFLKLKQIANEKGFSHVQSGPLVRSSYHAHQHL